MNQGSQKDNEGNRQGAANAISATERRVAVTDHRINSRDLFVATREVTIAHGDDVYRLRLTAQNKLILTK
jgi:hemin uptake protein HemP